MQFVINDELSCGPRLAVDRLNRILDLGGERVQELDAAGEEPSFLIDFVDCSGAVARALAVVGLRCPGPPESLQLNPLPPDHYKRSRRRPPDLCPAESGGRRPHCALLPPHCPPGAGLQDDGNGS
jgi:hypothetical protein